MMAGRERPERMRNTGMKCAPQMNRMCTRVPTMHRILQWRDGTGGHKTAE